MIKILFICHGNICRSATAEFVLKDMAAKAGLSDRFYIESAGTSDEEIWNAIEEAKKVEGKPHAIILDTIKGLGIDFAEAEEFNHYMTFDIEKAEEACAEIDRRLENGTYPGGDFKW